MISFNQVLQILFVLAPLALTVPCYIFALRKTLRRNLAQLIISNKPPKGDKSGFSIIVSRPFCTFLISIKAGFFYISFGGFYIEKVVTILGDTALSSACFGDSHGGKNPRGDGWELGGGGLYLVVLI